MSFEGDKVISLNNEEEEGSSSSFSPLSDSDKEPTASTSVPTRRIKSLVKKVTDKMPKAKRGKSKRKKSRPKKI